MANSNKYQRLFRATPTPVAAQRGEKIMMRLVIEMLKAGDLKAFRKWRIEHPAWKLRLAGVDLCGVDLPGVNLAGADLRASRLVESFLPGAVLTGALLAGADLSRANFSGAHLEDTDLTAATLTGACFRRAMLNNARFGAVEITRTDFRGANLTGVSLLHVREGGVERARFAEARLEVEARRIVRMALEAATYSPLMEFDS